MYTLHFCFHKHSIFIEQLVKSVCEEEEAEEEEEEEAEDEEEEEEADSLVLAEVCSRGLEHSSCHMPGNSCKYCICIPRSGHNMYQIDSQ